MIRAFEAELPLQHGQTLSVVTYLAGGPLAGQVQLVSFDTTAFRAEVAELVPSQARALAQALLQAAAAAETQSLLAHLPRPPALPPAMPPTAAQFTHHPTAA